MSISLLERLRDWNPQLFREIKGRLKVSNIALAIGSSLLGQFLLFLGWWRGTPINRYYYRDFFVQLSLILVLLLFVGGSYLLISDLSKEERKGTLNFIRLTPRSETSILTGKMLGVPILLYILAVAAVPLHLWAGLGAEIPLSLILTFYGGIVAGCIFFYSAALLFGLVSTWLGRFQAWLGSGAVFAFLILTFVHGYSQESVNKPIVWLRLFTPFDLMNSLYPFFGDDFLNSPPIKNLQWFYLAVDSSTVSLFCLMLLNYGLWTYWIWQGLKRCFRNPNSTIISKQQSYWIVACFEVVLWGFALQVPKKEGYFNDLLYDSGVWIICLNLLLFLGLIAVLSNQRQALQDWVRYRLQNISKHKNFWNSYLVRDLIFGEKSPAIVAMAINLLIATTPLLAFILITPVPNDEGKSLSDTKILLLCAVAFFISMMMIYASIAQRMLLMKNPKRSIWATVTIAGVFFVPPIMLNVLGISPYDNSTVWLFSSFSWTGIEPYWSPFSRVSSATFPEYPTMTAIFMAFLCELGVLTLLNVQLTQRLQKFGESASKSLLKDSPTLPRSSFK